MQRTKDTVPELALRRALHSRGLRYRLHRRLLPNSRRSVDIVFASARVAVDVRGCFWHGCVVHARVGSANSDWWKEKLLNNVKRDEDTVRRLEEAGWAVFIVWEHDDPEAAAERISSLVAKRKGEKIKPGDAVSGTPQCPAR